jgi:TPR repeat protein
MTKCGDFYNSGFGTCKADLPTAINYYLRSSKLGDVDATLNLGSIYEDQKKIDKAVEMY